MAEIRAFIFDMDGVIVDSNPLHRVSWEAYNKKHGLETTEAMHSRMYGRRNDQIVRDFFGEALTDQEVFAHGAAKEALYREMLLPIIDRSIVPGVKAFVQRHNTIPKAIATNAEPANVAFVLEHAGLAGCFSAIVDGHQVRNPKPHPEVYLTAADRLGISPEHCVVFEDSRGGVEAGLAAGMRVIGIATTHEDLAGVSLSIPNFLDPTLEPWLAQWLRPAS